MPDLPVLEQVRDASASPGVWAALERRAEMRGQSVGELIGSFVDTDLYLNERPESFELVYGYRPGAERDHADAS